MILTGNELARHDERREILREVATTLVGGLDGEHINSVQAEEPAMQHALLMTVARLGVAVDNLVGANMAWEAGGLVRSMFEASFVTAWLAGDDSNARSSYWRTRVWMLQGLEELLVLGDVDGPIEAARRVEIDNQIMWLKGELEQDRNHLQGHIELLKTLLRERLSELKEQVGTADDKEVFRRRFDSLGRALGGLERQRRDAARDDPWGSVPDVRAIAGAARALDYEEHYRLGSKHIHPSMHTVDKLLRGENGGGWTLTAPPKDVDVPIVRGALQALVDTTLTVVNYERSRKGTGPIVDLDEQSGLEDRLLNYRSTQDTV